MSYLWGTLHWTDKQAQRTCKSPQATDTRPKIHPVVNPLPIVMAVFFNISILQNVDENEITRQTKEEYFKGLFNSKLITK